MSERAAGDEQRVPAAGEPVGKEGANAPPEPEPETSTFGPLGILGCDDVEPAVSSWVEFVSEFALDASPSWIFRGQADFGWGLGTSLQRAFEAAEISDPTERANFENSSIGFFKDRARVYLEERPDDHDLLAWLSLMQHYGAPTRLQDWTRSPFVAAYFAYREDHGVDACLWAIQAFFCRRAITPSLLGYSWDHLGVMEELFPDPNTGETLTVVPSVEVTEPERENAILREAIRSHIAWPLPTAPFNVDARMSAQQAAFLVVTELAFGVEALLSKEDWPPQAQPDFFQKEIEERQARYPLDAPHQLIKRIRLPYAWRDKALRSLARWA